MNNILYFIDEILFVEGSEEKFYKVYIHEMFSYKMKVKLFSITELKEDLSKYDTKTLVRNFSLDDKNMTISFYRISTEVSINDLNKMRDLFNKDYIVDFAGTQYYLLSELLCEDSLVEMVDGTEDYLFNFDIDKYTKTLVYNDKNVLDSEDNIIQRNYDGEGRYTLFKLYNGTKDIYKDSKTVSDNNYIMNNFDMSTIDIFNEANLSFFGENGLEFPAFMIYKYLEYSAVSKATFLKFNSITSSIKEPTTIKLTNFIDSRSTKELYKKEYACFEYVSKLELKFQTLRDLFIKLKEFELKENKTMLDEVMQFHLLKELKIEYLKSNLFILLLTGFLEIEDKNAVINFYKRYKGTGNKFRFRFLSHIGG